MANTKGNYPNCNKIDLAELQSEMSARELETKTGRRLIGVDAYKEALATKARGSIKAKEDN